MIKVYPDYYEDFRCIAHKCRHNCCIGWEIDIDKETDEFYKSYTGNLKDRFINDICRYEDTPHFILKENERCPFLNEKNLCDIIIETGEAHLCTICREHPRFHNELPERVESGLGMCCEEAARLILTKKEPVTFIKTGEDEVFDEIIELRDKAISVLQNRNKTLLERTKDLLNNYGTPLPHTDIVKWADTFLDLERLDENWTDILNLIKNSDNSIEEFSKYIKDREYEYEQFAVYIIYRYMANAPDMFEASLRVSFAVLSTVLIFCAGAAIYEKNKKFTLEDQIELCRMFSCEIEYSDENIYVLYDELS
ncbi:MAG: flagellin lysine-N-methylase [Ruminococcus sp.]|nr:flagellin lysine-N-methylase [Ruminococcus sp.]